MVDVVLIVIAVIIPVVLLVVNLIILARYIDTTAVIGHWIAKIMIVRVWGNRIESIYGIP
jgi:hypothetical protein